MKEKMLFYLENNHWANARDFDLIKSFVEDFFNQCQPERLSEKTLYKNDEEMRLEEIHFQHE